MACRVLSSSAGEVFASGCDPAQNAVLQIGIQCQEIDKVGIPTSKNGQLGKGKDVSVRLETRSVFLSHVKNLRQA